MADREKVIKGLERHRVDNNHRIKCADCPYYVDDGNHIRCVNDLHDDAIALLKEQEAVEPLPQNSNGWVRTIKLWYCGACHSKISRRTSKYCPNCGRKVKWG